MRADGKRGRPHPDEVMAIVEAATVTNEVEAAELNDRVLALTRQPALPPAAHRVTLCSSDGCRKHAVLQEAVGCKGCEASPVFGDPHDHPVFFCAEHAPRSPDHVVHLTSRRSAI